MSQAERLNSVVEGIHENAYELEPGVASNVSPDEMELAGHILDWRTSVRQRG